MPLASTPVCDVRLIEQAHPGVMQVCRLAMLTLLAVFKDLFPAYRIRPAHEEEQPEKVVHACLLRL